MEYKNTVNLPKTDFPMKAGLSKKEPEILQKWNSLDIYNKILSGMSGKPDFMLHDGPPYANGDIHLGHALNKILKDIIVKYKNMRGFRSPYVPGWDCHGLPVEHQLFKNLGISKNGISQSDFRKKARAYAVKFAEIQSGQFRRLGVFGDWDHPYYTLDAEYETSILDSFAELADKGYVYRGLKPIYWCGKCETALAEAEIEYSDKKSPSVFVKFKAGSHVSEFIGSDKDAYFIIWTTTPWTLPANLAVALHPSFSYGAYETDGEIWIMATDLSGSFFGKTGLSPRLLKTFKGAELEGKKAEHPFIKRESAVVLADYVTLEQGTGCVHTAPGHGQEDYITGLKYGLDIYSPVDEKGCFRDNVEHFAGKNVFSANKDIIEFMKKKNVLVLSEEVEHSYPHCWRCKGPVIFRATEQWFINVDHKDLRKKTLDYAKKVRWLPSYGQNRISSMLENRPDWCLSRQRYWGVPIPVFYCGKCGKAVLSKKVINHVTSLMRENGGCDIWFDWDAAKLLPGNTVCECGSAEFVKEHDILDVWFESGVSHTAVMKQRGGLNYPADLYLEGSDQHRGWFQSSLLTAGALYGNAPYKTVLTHGFTIDEEGRKMSKSLGNVVDPLKVIEERGADILRLWVSSVDYTMDVALSEHILKQVSDSYRRIRNTFRYLLGNVSDFDYSSDGVDYQNLTAVDKWALSRLAALIHSVTDAYDNYDFCRVYHQIHNFCAVDMSSFYLDILKDRMYTFRAGSSERRSSQTVMHRILVSLSMMLAPVLSFTCEEVWEYIDIADKSPSVHMNGWPVCDAEWINKEIESDWAKLIRVKAEIDKLLEELRKNKKIGNSLQAKAVLYAKGGELKDFLLGYSDILKTVFIVSDVEVRDFEERKDSKGGDISGLEIRIDGADGAKCVRCWNYSKTVGTIEGHPEICERCFKVITDK
ncbi:MAG: isoleucine--tRNA ligase [bacterium]|nr:isoleucine--tRNA ligase [bacterium]